MGASVAVGIVIAIRVGGADMPVFISFLNATAGLAAAMCGVAIQNRLLIACGATVAASGSVLTHVMCRGMNRGLSSVFTGGQVASSPPPPTSGSASIAASATATASRESADPMTRAIDALRAAQRIIVIPGYGMALAEAQEDVVQLADQLASAGKDVKFAIHPVAGRMPGHMHVVLAEAELDYSRLFEMKDINDEFAKTDVALVVGACDVVNPAAIHSTNTPISGMPILKAYEAKHVIVCNLDERPGYSGVENPLYKDPRTIMLLGDARNTIAALRQALT
jgi:NAD(P) transhydrogenase subunit beta